MSSDTNNQTQTSTNNKLQNTSLSIVLAESNLVLYTNKMHSKHFSNFIKKIQNCIHSYYVKSVFEKPYTKKIKALQKKTKKQDEIVNNMSACSAPYIQSYGTIQLQAVYQKKDKEYKISIDLHNLYTPTKYLTFTNSNKKTANSYIIGNTQYSIQFHDEIVSILKKLKNTI